MNTSICVVCVCVCVCDCFEDSIEKGLGIVHHLKLKTSKDMATILIPRTIIDEL